MRIETGLRFLVGRNDLHRTRVTTDPDAPAARRLDPGELRLTIECFALTANTVGYASFGAAMRCWCHFPVGDSAWGCVPAWGFARVCESAHPAIPAGRRVFGCVPMGTHLVVRPGHVGARGFVDAARHREGLSAMYRQFLFCDADPNYDAAREGQLAVLRPLFTTAFLLDDHLAANRFFGARQILMSSASSKTAYGTAFCLALRRDSAPSVRIIGLTSTRNLRFAQSLGCYDDVLGYSDVDAMDGRVPSLYLDFAGNGPLRRTVHAHFGGSLVHSCALGDTHRFGSGVDSGLPGPIPTRFVTAAHALGRMAAPPAGWGVGMFRERLGRAWERFMDPVCDPDRPWLRVVGGRGADAVEKAFASVRLRGGEAREGLILSM